MPPNVKGGKAYKKGKHAEGDPKMITWDVDQGQMIGRVLKSVGNRRFRVYCNDNKERICRLCGSMRKSDWVNEGSLVVMGIRSLSTVTSENSSSKNSEAGDILSTIDQRLYGKLKKEPGINQALFTNIEEQDIRQVKKKVEDGVMDEDFFEHEDDDEDEGKNKKKVSMEEEKRDDFVNIDDI
jgi:initiation factor 1A